MTFPFHHSAVKRFFVGEDVELIEQNPVKTTVLGPQDPDASNITPADAADIEDHFALQIADDYDAAVFIGALTDIEKMLAGALDKIQEVIREQAEDSK